jgi:predicted dehydrogenase
MFTHPSIAVIFVLADDDVALRPFLKYLNPIAHIQYTVTPQMPQELGRYDVIVSAGHAALTEPPEHLIQFVDNGGGWLALIHPSDEILAPIFGVQPLPPGPFCEIRVMFKDANHPMAPRLPDAIYLSGLYRTFDMKNAAVETILYTDWHYSHSPVLVNRAVGKGQVACTTLQAYDNSGLQHLLYRLLRQLAGQQRDESSLGVGLLGYAPSVGKSHGLGAENTPGLVLRAACDLNPDRLKQAEMDFPGLKTYPSADEFADDPDVDLVIIATPPNIHARTCLQMMTAGKHVICEKPLALNRKETDEMVAMAEKQHVHLSCHQNRRWDVDYLAIKQALAEGLIGDLFYLETFVGGFSHPCGYWHSHAEVSGGTTYDWGGHYIDWMVGLIPDRVRAVIGTRHKRVWHDVTNADQERIQIRFSGGQEAEFLHSDIAAVRKPKWYLLGSEGAIVGHWRDVTAYEIDPVHYFRGNDIPATEMPPDLRLHRRHASGRIVVQKLAEPERQQYPFHRNIADHLITGEPLAAPLEDSVRVVAILEAAARSAVKGGTVEDLDV